MFNHKFYAFAPCPTFMSPAPSMTRSPENKTFYKSEINSVTITSSSQLRTQIQFENILRGGENSKTSKAHISLLQSLLVTQFRNIIIIQDLAV